MHLDVAVCLPQETETVALVRSVVTNTLLLFGVTDECVEDIRLALSEACNNVVEHAAGPDEYEVRVQIDDERCEITVTNPGEELDAASLAGAMPDPASVRGRGVAIMRALVDKVDFRFEPEAGTIVHLVKELAVREDGHLARLRQRPQR